MCFRVFAREEAASHRIYRNDVRENQGEIKRN